MVEIKILVPDLPMELTGSSALQIAGERDIDISVYCAKAEQPLYYDKFEQLFGNPLPEGKAHKAWGVQRGGYHVGIWLVDRKLSPTAQAVSNSINNLGSTRT